MTSRSFRQTRFRPPPGATEVLLVRHGESAPLVEGQPFDRTDGHGDPPLAPTGLRQAEAVGRRLAPERVDALYVTTLQRTHQTAAPLAAALGLEPRVRPELREVHLGEWEGGLLRQHAVEGHPIVAEMFTAQRWDVIPGAEPDDAFRARVRLGLELIHAEHPDQRVVAVVHGGVIGAALALATGARGFAFTAADNGSISTLVLHGERWHVRSFNDVAHLAELGDD